MRYFVIMKQNYFGLDLGYGRFIVVVTLRASKSFTLLASTAYMYVRDNYQSSSARRLGGEEDG